MERCFCKDKADLNKPELTGRRKYVTIGACQFPQTLMLQVEESVYTDVGGTRGWETRWRFATPDDLPGQTVEKWN